MKSKLNPIFILLGLFLFKIAIVDNFRNGTNNGERGVASASERSAGVVASR